MSARRAVVIGAGLGGLALALRLLHQGLEVVVLEQEPEIGGRAAQIRGRGYTFDAGPSLITMPWVLEELFALAGVRLQDRLQLRRLDPFYRISWQGERRSFLFSGDRDAMLEQIRQFSPADAGRYDAFLAASRRIYEEAILVAGRQDFQRFSSFLRLLPAMLRMGAVRPVDSFVGRFFKEPHVRQAFGFHPLFIGGDPFRVPAVYAALAYLQIEQGVWYAAGGVHALVQELGRLVRSGGGRIVTGRRVSRILTSGDRVRGVRTEEGEQVSADLVVSNADALATQAQLLERRPSKLTTTMSCFLLYLGTRRPYPSLHHHTLLVGRDYSRFIGDVTRRRRLPEDLSLYVHAPARTEPAMATGGGESIAVLLPVPNLAAGVDWERSGSVLRDRVVDALQSQEGLGLECLRESIEFEASWTPLDFRDRLGAVDGNAFAAEPTLSQSAYFRTPNRDRRLSGMYYVGAGTHPGAGIPGVLLGAEVTAALVARDTDGRP
ncbi:MAG: phytoene desaturase [Candidatus Nephthysia bennettiae]|uniref:Phytoene desaturase n=1 Tax=Candidatus Nephthysia bennettiae TaxID=3127016 RepID=A0A934NDL2_9BACT|nr:phytoene desaturase [Candidatus Dormibacteraeota bacterium]MBJ7613152.1 phytoene desaturase [Candidatus Dormibacteraeota bacterium]PZR93780.1 MAG: phytoene desaturase [Candidatus Dormibacteraeota bacterium]